mmetsp:Transcript_16414/g.50244  ORF Transcript_16414/g.50244 Transcript_16414/m.50244 type:complete len:220 (+) Transcript_16414:1232-1891(+)
MTSACAPTTWMAIGNACGARTSTPRTWSSTAAWIPPRAESPGAAGRPRAAAAVPTLILSQRLGAPTLGPPRPSRSGAAAPRGPRRSPAPSLGRSPRAPERPGRRTTAATTMTAFLTRSRRTRRARRRAPGAALGRTLGLALGPTLAATAPRASARRRAAAAAGAGRRSRSSRRRRRTRSRCSSCCSIRRRAPSRSYWISSALARLIWTRRSAPPRSSAC